MRVLLLTLMVCCMACSWDTRFRFNIKGNIKEIKYGKASLLWAENKDSVLFSTDIDGGKFELKGELDEPGRYILKVNRRSFYFFLDGKNMSVESPYSALNNKSLQGSPANELATRYNQYIDEHCYRGYNDVMRDYKAAVVAGKQDLSDSLLTEVLNYENRRYEMTRDFVKEYPDNIFSAYMADVVKGESHERGKVLYDLLSEKNKGSFYGRLLKKHTDDLAVSALGYSCPDFTVTDEAGNKVTLNSQKGNVLILDFWASWCGPCREEMKNLRKQYEEFKEKGIRVMSISLDDSEEKWRKACEEERIPWLSAWENKGWKKSEIRKLFGIETIPFIVLLDKDGNIVAKNIRRNNLREKIIELLQK